MYWVLFFVCCRFVESVKVGKDFCWNLLYVVDVKFFFEVLDVGSGLYKVMRVLVLN